MTPAPTRTAAAILVTRLPALARQVRGMPAAEIPAKGAGLATGTGTAALATATARNHRIEGSRSRSDGQSVCWPLGRGTSHGHGTRARRLSPIVSQKSGIHRTTDSDTEGRPCLCLVWVRETG